MKNSAKVFARRSISVCAGGGDSDCVGSAPGIGAKVGAATGAGVLIDGGVLASDAAGVGVGGVGCVGAGAGAAVA